MRDHAAYMRAYRARLKAENPQDPRLQENPEVVKRKRLVWKLTRAGVPRDEARRLAREVEA